MFGRLCITVMVLFLRSIRWIVRKLADNLDSVKAALARLLVLRKVALTDCLGKYARRKAVSGSAVFPETAWRLVRGLPVAAAGSVSCVPGDGLG